MNSVVVSLSAKLVLLALTVTALCAAIVIGSAALDEQTYASDIEITAFEQSLTELAGQINARIETQNEQADEIVATLREQVQKTRGMDTQPDDGGDS